MIQKEDVLKLFALVSPVFPRDPRVTDPDIQEQAVVIYAQLLERFHQDELLEAARTHLQRSNFWPTPADLIGIMVQARETIPLYFQAWQQVYEASRAGAGGRIPLEPTWSHELITEAVKSLGWTTICRSDASSALHAQFRDIYNALLNDYLQGLRRGRITAPRARCGSPEDAG